MPAKGAREQVPIFIGLVKAWAFEGLGVGDPGMTRTCDLRFRKPSLYPAELRDRRPAGRRGRLKSPYQSAVMIASLRIVPICSHGD